MTRPLCLGMLALCPALFAACTDDAARGEGSVRVSVHAEDTITLGLSPGSAPEDTLDYGVSYSKFIVALVGVSAKTVGQFVAVVVAAVGVYLKANAPKAEA